MNVDPSSGLLPADSPASAAQAELPMALPVPVQARAEDTHGPVIAAMFMAAWDLLVSARQDTPPL